MYTQIIVNQDISKPSQSFPVHVRVQPLDAVTEPRLDSVNVCKLRMTPS
jgi:hypothetical protein